MTDREFLLQRRKAEFPLFLKVFKALPPDNLDYRLEPKARSARELVGHMIYEELIAAELLDTGCVHFHEPPPPADFEEMIAAFENAYAQLEKGLRPLTDADWKNKGEIDFRGKRFPLVYGDFLWFLFFGLIHHRGQLSTYIRPMGGKVPAIYGPSADATS